MDITELSRLLSDRAESVAIHLLPNGKKEHNEWVVGNINGHPGKSCKVRIEGSKKGVWSDFATGDKGDLIDLWKMARGLSFKDALKDIKLYLGIREEKREVKEHKRPKLPKTTTKIQKSIIEYLRGRGLKDESIKAYKVYEDNGKILFPSFRHDELIFYKHLAIERTENGKKTTWVSPECEPCLFGWQAIDPERREIVICEGEIDAMTLYQYGKPAVSVPFGGGAGGKQNWIEYEWENLEQYEVIYLCMDMDEEGKRASREIANRLGLHRCKIVELPHKDANECLKIGVAPIDIFTAFSNSYTIDPDELKRAGVFTKAVIEKYYPSNGKQPGYNLPWEKTHGRIRILPSEVSVWAGYNGAGKSLFLGQVMVEALKQSLKACIASFEMSAEKTLYRLIYQELGSQPAKVQIQTEMEKLNTGLWIFDLVGTGKPDKMMEVFKYAYQRYGISQFVVDSLAKLGMAEDDYAGQKQIVERFGDFVRQTNAHIHLIAHARKGRDEFSPPRKMDIKGTGAITDMVDNVYIIHRNKAKYKELANAKANNKPISDILKKPDTLLICDKSRENGSDAEGIYGLYFDNYFRIFTEERREFYESNRNDIQGLPDEEQA